LKQEEIEKIDRYINGVADETDREFVESLLSDGENNLYLRNRLNKDWESISNTESGHNVRLEYLLDHIHHIIRKNEANKKPDPIKRIVKFYMKAAAILIIPLLVAGSLIYYKTFSKFLSAADKEVTSSIYAPMGSRVSFNLPDGTTGMLNSGSRLDYSTPFTSDRKVKLEGEAWFDVSHDEKHPFEITAGSSVVKVLGTSFNISAYPAENYIEVVLNSGKVEYQSNFSKEIVTLMPSERLICHEGITGKTVVDPGKYNAWTDGKLVFRGDPMAEVARRIERWYNVKIRIADKELEKYSFRATFQDDKLEDVLRFLAMTSPIRYRIFPRKLMPDDTYSKEEVVIYIKN